ncbi:MAG: hypothetical protein M4D80_08470 [Myxococcota bacterium]|nr:hypothetical protein [Myxococcota bacterium]
MSTTGTIVVLNGPSSAGKTTLAQAVRARVGIGATGQARDQHARVFHDASYALRLDTS